MRRENLHKQQRAQIDRHFERQGHQREQRDWLVALLLLAAGWGAIELALALEFPRILKWSLIVLGALGVGYFVRFVSARLLPGK